MPLNLPMNLKIECNWDPSRNDFRTALDQEGCTNIATVTVRNSEVQLCRECAERPPWDKHKATNIPLHDIEFRLMRYATQEIERLSLKA